MSNTQVSYWTNVTPQQPCPICRRGDWCFLSKDGRFAGCRREARFDGEHRIDASGCDFWLYDLSGVSGHIVTPPPPSLPKEQEPPPRADADTLNKIYRELLSKLLLSDLHKNQLKKRGLPEEDIERRLYKTWPKTGRAKIAKALALQFGDDVLKKTPGFYLKSDSKDASVKYWSLAGGAGMAIPVRGTDRRIVAILLRLDDPKPGAGKYVWLSSSKHNGPSPGAPLQFPGFDEELLNQKTIRITEGALKADIATVLSGVFTIGIPGVLNWRAALPVLEKFPSLKKILIAYDADAAQNVYVATALKDFALALSAKDRNVEIETWDINTGKGIDDVLAAGGDVSYITGENIGPCLEEMLEAAKKANPPVHVKKLDEAKRRIDIDNLSEKLDSPDFLNDRENIEALKTIKSLSPGDWLSRIKTVLRKKSIWQEVNKLVDSQKTFQMKTGGPLPSMNGSASPNINRVSFYPTEAHGPPPRPPVKSIFDDAPVSDEIVIPEGYDFGTGGIWCTRNKFPEKVCDVPAIIDRRMKDVNTGVEHVSLRWKYGGYWASYIAPKSSVFTSRKIVDIADYGLPVRTDNALSLSKWLGDFESENYELLPVSSISSQLGWQGRNSSLGFLLGENFYKSSSNAPEHIEFRGLDTGDKRLADGFQSEGTLESWIEAVAPVAAYPRVLLMLYASFAAPLMPILDAPNFIIDSSSVTSRGKTVSLRVAGSVWGNPNERSNQGTVVHSWNNTNVFIERLSSTLGNLPILLDDTKQVRNPKQIASILYMFASGHGRGRGSQKGTQDTLHWNSILLSTGEQKITTFTTDGGTRGRVLSIWHPEGPFESTSQKTAILVTQLNQAVTSNYGTAGKRFIEWLIEHREDWSLFREKYREQQKEYARMAGDNPVALRLTEFFAVIDIAAVLMHAAIQPPWKYRDPIESLWNDLTEDSEIDLCQDAASFVLSWAQSHEHTFRGRENKGNDSPYTKAPMGGWSGRWADEEEWKTIAFYPHLLKKIVEEAGHNYDATVRIWRDKGWLDCGADRKRFTKKIKINGVSEWFVSIKREAFEDEADLFE